MLKAEECKIDFYMYHILALMQHLEEMCARWPVREKWYKYGVVTMITVITEHVCR